MTLDARLPDEPGPWTVVRVGPARGAATVREARLRERIIPCAWPPRPAASWKIGRGSSNGPAGVRSAHRPRPIALCGDKLRLGRAPPRPAGSRPPVPPRGPGPRPAPRSSLSGRPEADRRRGVARHLSSWNRPGRSPPRPSPCPRPSSSRSSPASRSSASFLVAPGGRPRGVGVGRQVFSRRDGLFVYEGGVLPFRGCEDPPEALAAVESVAGLCGWVGVDFLRDDLTGRVTILEINPRVTTSYVGWRAALSVAPCPRRGMARDDPRSRPLPPRPTPGRRVPASSGSGRTGRSTGSGEGDPAVGPGSGPARMNALIDHVASGQAFFCAALVGLAVLAALRSPGRWRGDRADPRGEPGADLRGDLGHPAAGVVRGPGGGPRALAWIGIEGSTRPPFAGRNSASASRFSLPWGRGSRWRLPTIECLPCPLSGGPALVPRGRFPGGRAGRRGEHVAEAALESHGIVLQDLSPIGAGVASALDASRSVAESGGAGARGDRRE